MAKRRGRLEIMLTSIQSYIAEAGLPGFEVRQKGKIVVRHHSNTGETASFETPRHRKHGTKREHSLPRTSLCRPHSKKVEPRSSMRTPEFFAVHQCPFTRTHVRTHVRIHSKAQPSFRTPCVNPFITSSGLCATHQTSTPNLELGHRGWK